MRHTGSVPRKPPTYQKPIQKWEYVCMICDNKPPTPHELNDQGEGGWELVTILKQKGWDGNEVIDQYYCYLKRPLDN